MSTKEAVLRRPGPPCRWGLGSQGPAPPKASPRECASQSYGTADAGGPGCQELSGSTADSTIRRTLAQDPGHFDVCLTGGSRCRRSFTHERLGSHRAAYLPSRSREAARCDIQGPKHTGATCKEGMASRRARTAQAAPRLASTCELQARPRAGRGSPEVARQSAPRASQWAGHAPSQAGSHHRVAQSKGTAAQG